MYEETAVFNYRILFRCSAADNNRWHIAAAKSGLSFSEWARNALNQACGLPVHTNNESPPPDYTLPKPPPPPPPKLIPDGRCERCQRIGMPGCPNCPKNVKQSVARE